MSLETITTIAVTPETTTLKAMEFTSIVFMEDEELVFTTDGNCSNYCLHGSCFFSAHAPNDSPACSCEDGWTGARCEADPCHNWCLEDGECILLDSEPECLCQLGHLGDRCQVINDAEAMTQSLDIPCSRVLILTLSTTTGILCLVTILLSVHLHRMRLRPRIVRKRFISVADKEGSVKKTKTGCEGLPVSDGLQLDIENCCNMSLCETVNILIPAFLL